MTQLDAWDAALADAKHVFDKLAQQGIVLKMVNMGGGFPTKYLKDIPTAQAYGQAIFARAVQAFRQPACPRRSSNPAAAWSVMPASSSRKSCSISKKSDNDAVRWVFLDIGKFGGLAETMDEAIRYPIRTARDGDEMEPCVLAGPTCDSADVLYEKDAVSAAGFADHRRRGADRGDGRLHDHLFLGRLQRLRAAPILRDLTVRRMAGEVAHKGGAGLFPRPDTRTPPFLT